MTVLLSSAYVDPEKKILYEALCIHSGALLASILRVRSNFVAALQSLSLSPWERRHVLLAHQPYQSIPSPSSVIIRYCAVCMHALRRISKVLEIHRFSRRMQRHRQLSHPFAVQGQPTIYLLFLFLPDFHIRRGRKGGGKSPFV